MSPNSSLTDNAFGTVVSIVGRPADNRALVRCSLLDLTTKEITAQFIYDKPEIGMRCTVYNERVPFQTISGSFTVDVYAIKSDTKSMIDSLDVWGLLSRSHSSDWRQINQVIETARNRRIADQNYIDMVGDRIARPLTISSPTVITGNHDPISVDVVGSGVSVVDALTGREYTVVNEDFFDDDEGLIIDEDDDGPEDYDTEPIDVNRVSQNGSAIRLTAGVSSITIYPYEPPVPKKSRSIRIDPNE